MTYGEKCLIEAAIDKASISHGSHVTWCLRTFELKNPANWSLLDRLVYMVDPKPFALIEPSVTIQSSSFGRGIVMTLFDERSC